MRKHKSFNPEKRDTRFFRAKFYALHDGAKYDISKNPLKLHI